MTYMLLYNYGAVSNDLVVLNLHHSNTKTSKANEDSIRFLQTL